MSKSKKQKWTVRYDFIKNEYVVVESKWWYIVKFKSIDEAKREAEILNKYPS